MRWKPKLNSIAPGIDTNLSKYGGKGESLQGRGSAAIPLQTNPCVP
jgi:hypothetical protein